MAELKEAKTKKSSKKKAAAKKVQTAGSIEQKEEAPAVKPDNPVYTPGVCVRLDRARVKKIKGAKLAIIFKHKERGGGYEFAPSSIIPRESQLVYSFKDRATFLSFLDGGRRPIWLYEEIAITSGNEKWYQAIPYNPSPLTDSDITPEQAAYDTQWDEWDEAIKEAQRGKFEDLIKIGLVCLVIIVCSIIMFLMQAASLKAGR